MHRFPSFSSRAISLCLCLLFFASFGFAQGVLGSVTGVVRDSSGAVIPGANVTLKNNGTNAVRTTVSGQEGQFTFPQVDNGTYTVTVEKSGFRKAVYSQIAVLPAQQYSMVANLAIGAQSEQVEVVAGQDLVNTSSSEVADTVEQKQILELPLLGRNPIELIRNQAGVPGILDATRNTTTINGARPGWTQTTQDGINIQDNFIRTNANDFVQNRPTSDSIGEFSIISNTPGAGSVGGTSQVRLVTPNGTNAIHGDVYEYNRNSALAANDHWNKRATPVIPKDFLNQNQFGFTVGGPIFKDKLFYHVNYEGFRLRQTGSSTILVPKTSNYLDGIYTLPNGQQVDVLAQINAHRTAGLPALAIDPTIKSTFLDRFNKTAPNVASCSALSDKYNTGCYSFTQSNPTDRNQIASRFDYELNSKHHFEFVFQRFTDFDARTDIDLIHANPQASLATNVKLFAGAWRWTVSPTFFNEFRAGDNSSVVPFQNNTKIPAWFGSYNTTYYFLNNINLTTPDVYFMPQGRRVTTRQYMDNASWTRGNHAYTFGFTYADYQPHTYNYASTLPTLTFGFDPSTANAGYLLDAVKMPGYSSSALSAMNSYAAFLTGMISGATQTFQAVSKDKGFVSGAPNSRRYQYTIYSPYFQDQWRIKSNLTLNYGIKWEYWTPLKEQNGLMFLPDMTGSDMTASLLNPAGTVSFQKQAYTPDKKQLAPNVGLAWDPFKDGKTSIRAGYSMSYVNEDMVTALNNVFNGNFGLASAKTLNFLAKNLTTDGVPAIPSPTFATQRTYLSQLTNSGITAAAWGVQGDLSTPWAHQIDFEIQREVGWDTAVTARYVATLGRDLWRGIDVNQQMVMSNTGFVNDFNNARYNLITCGNPRATTTTCSSAKALNWFPTFTGGLSSLGSATVQNYLYWGQMGTLADYYVQRRGTYTQAAATFLPNPNIYAADEMINGAQTNYHALQMEVRHRTKNGLSFQANYTFSKLLSDANGNTQARFEPFIDNNNKHFDYGRAEYDLTHVINTNFTYDLPFGRGKWLLRDANGVVDRIVGGWKASSIIRWQSGSPFSIISGYGTVNRGGRSAGMTAYSTLTPNQIKKLLGIKIIDGTVYYIDPKVLGPDGYAVNYDYDQLTYSPAFDGQVFYNPQPGTFGNLKRLQFDGPSAFSWDFSLAKATKITERINTEFRADFFNVLNHNNFILYTDYNVNSSTFGQISHSMPPRIIQMSLRVKF